jgi:DNA-binding MarR family transcriptional regulator
MAERPTGGPEKFLCFKLSRVMRKVQHYYEIRLSPFGVTPVQFYVLAAMWEQDGIKFKDLASGTSMDGATLTGILDRLERLDLVERRNDPDDRRSRLIFLQEEAKKIKNEMTGIALGLNREIAEQFPAQDFQTFLKVLDQLSEQG